MNATVPAPHPKWPQDIPLPLLGFDEEKFVDADPGVHRAFVACRPLPGFVGAYFQYRETEFMVRIWQGCVQSPAEFVTNGFARGAPVLDQKADSPLQIQAIIFDFIQRYRT